MATTRWTRSLWLASPSPIRALVRLKLPSRGPHRADSFAFAAVVLNGSDLGQAPASGILGLAWSRLATTGFQPFWQTLASSGQLNTSEFSFYFARYQNNKTATAIEADGGEFTLG